MVPLDYTMKIKIIIGISEPCKSGKIHQNVILN